jgi:hypothetical protein
MRRGLLKALMWVVGVQIALAVVGRIVSERRSKGDEDSDEFTVAAILGGKQFRSTAKNLTSGIATASMGGIDLDLRGATLAPAGARLDLNAMLGGIQVTVPDTWRVEVDKEIAAGGVDVKVTPAEELPEDAPRLHVRAVARMGGELVTTGAG